MEPEYYMVHAVAVAFWNASYGAACDVAQGTPPRQRPAAAERAMAAMGSEAPAPKYHNPEPAP